MYNVHSVYCCFTQLACHWRFFRETPKKSKTNTKSDFKPVFNLAPPRALDRSQFSVEKLCLLFFSFFPFFPCFSWKAPSRCRRRCNKHRCSIALDAPVMTRRPRRQQQLQQALTQRWVDDFLQVSQSVSRSVSQRNV